MNENAGDTAVSLRQHVFNRSRLDRPTPFGQGIVPRTPEGITESIGPPVPDYSANGEDIYSAYTSTCIKDSVVKNNFTANLSSPTQRRRQTGESAIRQCNPKVWTLRRDNVKMLMSIENSSEVSDETLLDLWHVQVAPI